MLSRCVSTKLCLWSFKFSFSNLNYVVKLPDWPVPGYHGNSIKNPETQFCAHCHNAPTTQVWLTCDIFVFELHPFLCLANQRASSVVMATRSK